MAWYRTGKIAINKSSKVVTGTGTDFMDAVRPGFVLQAPDGKVYEVDNVLTATVMHIVESYAGNNVSNADYAIWQTQGEIPALAKTATDLIGRFGRIADAFDTGILEPVLSGQILDVAEGVASAKAATLQAGLEAEKALAEANRAKAAADNAVAVVTGGTATLLPAAAKIPLARADATVDPNWLGRTALPLIRPVFAADFTKGVIDSRVVHTRSTIGTEVGQTGVMRTAPINEPRLDFDPTTGLCWGPLIESQTTNLVVNSEGGHTAGVNASVTTSVEPMRGMVGWVVFGDNSTIRRSFRSASVVPDQDATVSVFVVMDDGGAPTNSDFITAVANGTSAFTVEDYGGGMYRVTCSRPASTNAAIFGIEKRVTHSNRGFRATGFMVTLGLNKTSYIPTDGTQATRAHDNLSIPLGDWFNRQEGTLFADYQAPAYAPGFVAGIWGDPNNYLALDYTPPSGARPGVSYMRLGGIFYNNPNIISPAVRRRVALSWKAGSVCRTGLNGAVSASPSALPANFLAPGTTIAFGRTNAGGAAPFIGSIASVRYYDKALTGEQLQALTAI